MPLVCSILNGFRFSSIKKNIIGQSTKAYSAKLRKISNLSTKKPFYLIYHLTITYLACLLSF